MVNENVDIAMILSNNAGHRLSEAFKIHQKMTSKKLPEKKYFELRAEERKACIEAVILFQASMEAMINEEIESEPRLKRIKEENQNLNSKFRTLSFKNKWQQAFEILAIAAKDKTYLEKYLQFYIRFRVPITHAKSRYVDAENFNFPNVYDGLKNGLLAVEAFYKKLGKFYIEHAWETFAKKCGLPL